VLIIAIIIIIPPGPDPEQWNWMSITGKKDQYAMTTWDGKISVWDLNSGNKISVIDTGEDIFELKRSQF